jgi:hypothetical protein
MDKQQEREIYIGRIKVNSFAIVLVVAASKCHCQRKQQSVRRCPIVTGGLVQLGELPAESNCQRQSERAASPIEQTVRSAREHGPDPLII